MNTKKRGRPVRAISKLNKDGSVDKRFSVPGKKKDERILSREQEAELFKHLIDKTAIEAAEAMGITDRYETNASIRIYVFNVVRRIKKAPELWGISKDAVDMVQKALDSRAVVKSSQVIKEKQREEFKDRLEVIRDTAADILTKKLAIINKNKNTLDGVKLKDISDIMKDAYQSIRLIKGESTDNVIHYSKVDLDKVTPEEAMNLILKARENLIESKK